MIEQTFVPLAEGIERLTLPLPTGPKHVHCYLVDGTLFDTGLGLGDAPWVYFVHSLHGVPNDAEVVAATTSYGGIVNAAFRLGNVFATQFHPEKSATAGLALLTNFVGLAARSAVDA
jgi:imidazoleglycerol phosphate synthase glutamine amidotransferase subunit HisH